MTNKEELIKMLAGSDDQWECCEVCGDEKPIDKLDDNLLCDGCRRLDYFQKQVLIFLSAILDDQRMIFEQLQLLKKRDEI